MVQRFPLPLLKRRDIGRRVLAGLDQACVAREEPQSQLARPSRCWSRSRRTQPSNVSLSCVSVIPSLLSSSPCRGPQAAAYTPSSVPSVVRLRPSSCSALKSSWYLRLPPAGGRDLAGGQSVAGAPGNAAANWLSRAGRARGLNRVRRSLAWLVPLAPRAGGETAHEHNCLDRRRRHDHCPRGDRRSTG